MASELEKVLELPDVTEISKAIDAMNEKLEKSVEGDNNELVVQSFEDDPDYAEVVMEMDTIANQADSTFILLMGKFDSVPPKDLGKVAESAEKFLTAKLNAKTFKSKYKLDKANLLLRKQKLENDISKDSNKDDIQDVSGGIDRNSMIDD